MITGGTTQTTIPVVVTGNGTVFYNVQYSPQIGVSYSVTVLLNGVVATQASPYALVVSPGALNSPASIIQGLPATLEAGVPFVYTVIPKDQFGNTLTAVVPLTLAV